MKKAYLSAAALVCAVGSTVSAQQLYTNGPLATTPTGACIPAGSQSSEVQPPGINAGYNVTVGVARCADDFLVDGAGWTVTGVTFPGYQTGGGSGASTFTAVNYQIWNGQPGTPGATVVFGDLTTNRLANSTFSNIYRYFTATCALDRAIFNNAATGGTTLTPGTYWLDWQMAGTLGSGPWAPQVTITGQPGKPGANAIQFFGGVWSPVVDGGVPQDFAFTVEGVPVGGTVGACCLPAGTCVQTTSAGCTASGGIYRGDNSPCGPTANCPQPGACCLPNGNCTLTNAAGCTAAGGIYRGDGSACGATANCPPPAGVWIEQGDAGGTPATANVTAGNGALNEIRGTAPVEDMYRIQICNPGAFNATLVGGATWDTQLFLFNAAGMGVSFNDDSVGLQSTITNQFTSALPVGIFNLAVSGYDNDATNNGAEIWLDQPFGVERAPDGPGAGGAVTGWTGAGASGAYSIFLQGACYSQPGTTGCYANCDESTTEPVLNVADFTCFLQRFAAGESYANCDESTQQPVLNVADFTCFLQEFAAGCP